MFRNENGNFFHLLFTALWKPCDSGSRLEVVLGSRASRKIRGPGHAFRCVNCSVLNAAALALEDGIRFLVIFGPGREKIRVRGLHFWVQTLFTASGMARLGGCQMDS